MKILATILSFLLLPTVAIATENTEKVTPQEISVAGFFPIEDSGRQVYDFNNGWRYHLGDVTDGQAVGLDVPSGKSCLDAPHSRTSSGRRKRMSQLSGCGVVSQTFRDAFRHKR